MRKVILTAAVIATVWSVGAVAGGIGVVDMKTIFSTSPKVKAIKAELNTQFNPQKTKLEVMGKALQADIAKYQKNKEVLNKKDLTAMEQNITTEESKFRDAQTQFQQDVFKAQNDRLTQFMDSVKAAVKVIAEKDKLSLVIPNNDVLYTGTNMDITQQVLADMK